MAVVTTETEVISVTIELSVEEAEALLLLTGKMIGGSITASTYDELHAAGVRCNKLLFANTSQGQHRVNSLTMHERF